MRTPKIYFYDVGLASYLLGIELYETGWGINAIEIKWGATVNNDMFRSLGRVADLLPNVVSKTLVYGGDRSQSRTDLDIVPLAEFAGSLARFEATDVMRRSGAAWRDNELPEAMYHWGRASGYSSGR